MSNMSIDQVLNQMRALSQNNTLPEAGINSDIKANASDRPQFSELLSDSISKVNTLQQEAGSLKTSFELGDANVDLPEVMVAVQKASLSFEAVTEVRNKLLSAYQEVMNMQV